MLIHVIQHDHDDLHPNYKWLLVERRIHMEFKPLIGITYEFIFQIVNTFLVFLLLKKLLKRNPNNLKAKQALTQIKQLL